jgi:hypothetical protein
LTKEDLTPKATQSNSNKCLKLTIGNAGFVELLDTFGDKDLAVVNAARVSFAKEST